MRLGNVGHNHHTHDDSDPIASARKYRHCDVQVTRRAKERKSDEFSLSESGNVISDADTNTNADVGLVARFGSRIQPKLRQDACLVAESNRLPNLHAYLVQIRLGKRESVLDQFDTRFRIVRDYHFNDVEPEKNIRVI